MLDKIFFVVVFLFFSSNFIPFGASTVISLIPHRAMISSACHGTKQCLQASVFQNIRYPGFYDSYKWQQNRFCTNNQPAEGTSDPAYIQRPVSAYTWIFLFLRSLTWKLYSWYPISASKTFNKYCPDFRRRLSSRRVYTHWRGEKSFAHPLFKLLT